MTSSIPVLDRVDPTPPRLTSTTPMSAGLSDVALVVDLRPANTARGPTNVVPTVTPDLRPVGRAAGDTASEAARAAAREPCGRPVGVPPVPVDPRAVLRPAVASWGLAESTRPRNTAKP